MNLRKITLAFALTIGVFTCMERQGFTERSNHSSFEIIESDDSSFEMAIDKEQQKKEEQKRIQQKQKKEELEKLQKLQKLEELLKKKEEYKIKHPTDNCIRKQQSQRLKGIAGEINKLNEESQELQKLNKTRKIRTTPREKLKRIREKLKKIEEIKEITQEIIEEKKANRDDNTSRKQQLQQQKLEEMIREFEKRGSYEYYKELLLKEFIGKLGFNELKRLKVAIQEAIKQPIQETTKIKLKILNLLLAKKLTNNYIVKNEKLDEFISLNGVKEVYQSDENQIILVYVDSTGRTAATNILNAGQTKKMGIQELKNINNLIQAQKELTEELSKELSNLKKNENEIRKQKITSIEKLTITDINNFFNVDIIHNYISGDKSLGDFDEYINKIAEILQSNKETVLMLIDTRNKIMEIGRENFDLVSLNGIILIKYRLSQFDGCSKEENNDFCKICSSEAKNGLYARLSRDKNPISKEELKEICNKLRKVNNNENKRKIMFINLEIYNKSKNTIKE